MYLNRNTGTISRENLKKKVDKVKPIEKNVADTISPAAENQDIHQIEIQSQSENQSENQSKNSDEDYENMLDPNLLSSDEEESENDIGEKSGSSNS